MKLLKSVRTISGNRATKIDPGPPVIISEPDHIHTNLELLEKIKVTNNYIKIEDRPVATHLLKEEW